MGYANPGFSMPFTGGCGGPPDVFDPFPGDFMPGMGGSNAPDYGMGDFPWFGGSMGFADPIDSLMDPIWMDECVVTRPDVCCGKDANTCGTAFGCAWGKPREHAGRRRSLQQYFTPKPQPDGVVGVYNDGALKDQDPFGNEMPGSNMHAEDGCWPEPEVHPLCTFNATAARTALGLIRGTTSARRLQQFDFPMPGDFGDGQGMPGLGDIPSTGGSMPPNPMFDFFMGPPMPAPQGEDMDFHQAHQEREAQELDRLLDLAARFPMQCCTKDAAACNQASTCTYEGGACRPTDPQFNDEPGEGGASPPWGATGMPGDGSSPPWDGLYPEPPNATVAFAFSFSSAADSDLSALGDKFASIFSKASKIPMDRIEVEVKPQLPTPMRKLSQSGGAPGQTFIVEVYILAESVSEGRMVVKALTEGILQGAGTAGFPKLEEALKDEGVTLSSIDLVMKPEMKPWEGTDDQWEDGASPPWDDTGMPGSGSSPPYDDTGMPTKPDGPECAERMVRAPSPPTLLGPHPPGARRRRGKVVWGVLTWATRRRPPSSRWW